MKVSGMFPSKYASADEHEQGTKLALTIASVDLEQIGQDPPEEKYVLHFQEPGAKGLVLNKTNAQTIAGLHGDDSDGWIGKRIQLIVTQTEFRGRMVACLRVMLEVPATPERRGKDEPHMIERLRDLIEQSGDLDQLAEAVEEVRAHDADGLLSDRAKKDLLAAHAATKAAIETIGSGDIPF